MTIDPAWRSPSELAAAARRKFGDDTLPARITCRHRAGRGHRGGKEMSRQERDPLSKNSVLNDAVFIPKSGRSTVVCGNLHSDNETMERIKLAIETPNRNELAYNLICCGDISNGDSGKHVRRNGNTLHTAAILLTLQQQFPNQVTIRYLASYHPKLKEILRNVFLK